MCTDEWVNGCQLPSTKELHDARVTKKGRRHHHRACTPRQPSALKLFLWETEPPLHSHPPPPSVTVCKPTCVTVNMLLTANWSLFSKCYSEKLRQCVQSFGLFGFCPIQLDFFFTLEIPEIHGCNTASLTVPKSEGGLCIAHHHHQTRLIKWKV